VSTALAIAATTRVLGDLIVQNINNADVSSVLGNPPFLTTRAPDQLESATEELAQLSLFLYHVTYNQGWREVGLPSRDSSGVPIDRPPLALDLHYLLVAYGDSDYIPQMLLGLGMQALHETPFLTKDEISSVFSGPLSQVDSALATAELADQVETIKVTPEPLNTEDLSKLWTAFGGKFRPSAGYEATVVLIESTASFQTALPVRQRPTPLVVQFSAPTVTAVTPQFLPWAAAPPTLTLTGTNLTSPGTVVVFANNPSEPQTPQPTGTSTTQVTVTVPTLPAGVNTLQVVQQMAVGASPVKNILESNVSLFYLEPVIRPGPTPPNGLITVEPVDTTQTPPLTPISVVLDPVLTSTQQVQLLLYQFDPPGATALAFTFDADPSQISGNTVTFSTFGVPSGTYLVRVRVDGATSELQPDPADPQNQPYAYPRVTL
jgi:Pvc16 N-terminal domain